MPVVGDSGVGSDWEYLRKKELAGEIISLISSDFNGNADQITYTVPSGKRFFFMKAKLYPVVDTVHGETTVIGATSNRRAFVSITFDGVVKDILTHDEESRTTYGSYSPGLTTANTGQYESNFFGSILGDGIKQVKLTSTNTSGTYRVSLLGWIE